MANHYTVDPDKAGQKEFDISIDDFVIVGTDRSFDVEAILDIDDLMEEESLRDAKVVKARSIFGEFLAEYEADSETFGVFLSYVENGWDYKEMWEESDFSMRQVNSATEVLEEDYGLIETNYGDVDLTERGDEVYEAFDILSEYED